MASPLTSSSDYNVARKLQEEYLAASKKRWEQEKLSEAVARKLERDLQNRDEDRLSELVALKLAQELQAERQSSDEELARKLDRESRNVELSSRILSQTFSSSSRQRPRRDSGPHAAGAERHRRMHQRSVDIDALIQAEFAPQHPVHDRSPPPPYHISSPTSSFPIDNISSPAPHARRRSRVSPGFRHAGRALDVDQLTYEELQLLCERNGDVKDKGAPAQVVSNLPTTTFEAKSSNVEDESNSCSICLMPFKKRELVKTLPCFHKFHAKEIDKWLAKNNSCPICKLPADS